MTNQILLSILILQIALVIAAWRSPGVKYWIGARLQASAKADEIRKAEYEVLVAKFEETPAAIMEFEPQYAAAEQTV